MTDFFRYKVSSSVSCASSSGIYALCLDDNCAFDKQLLAAWKNPIQIEADFIQRTKIRKLEPEEDKNPQNNNTSQPPAKKQKIMYKARPRVLLTGFSDTEKKDLIEKVQVLLIIFQESLKKLKIPVSKKKIY